ncbi:MAG: hypothetical protein R3E87_26310 [Burkholderiaceae bacterium]
MTTRALYREDARPRACDARVTHVHEDGFDFDATVFYPPGAGQAGDTSWLRLRLLRIAGVDLQPCGGTDVASTAEIGDVRFAKIAQKSARARRLDLRFGGTR